MRRGVLAIGAEILPVLLVLAALGGTWLAIVLMYRRQVPQDPPVAAVQPPTPAPSEAPRPAPAPEPEPEPEKPPPPAAPPIDPTPEILADLARQEAEQRQTAASATRRSEALERSRAAAMARAASQTRRMALAAAQAARLDAQARRLESEVAGLARRRDVLARTRDDLRTALASARAPGSAAVLPYKGPNGTWRRPIAIECRNGTATIQPDGPSFSLLELTRGFGRGSPLAAVLSVYRDRIESAPSPDGAPVVPYVLFVVRPDGIRPYYEARAQLEPLGLTFGYELVEQDEPIEYPDLTNLAEWSENRTLRDHLAGGGSVWLEGIDPDQTDAWSAGTAPAADLAADPGWPGFRNDSGVAGVGSSRPQLAAPNRGLADEAPTQTRQGQPGPQVMDEFVWPRGPSGVAQAAQGVDDPWRGLPAGRPGLESVASAAARGDAPAADLAASGGLAGPDRSRSPATGLPDLTGSSLPPGATHGNAPTTNAGTAAGTEVGSPGASRILPVVPLDLVVVCRPNGVLIQPGGYRLAASALESGDLATTLRRVVRQRQAREPAVRLGPRVKFLVEPGGQQTYWDARRQTTLAGLGWPVWLEVAEGDVSTRLLDGEVFR